MFEEYLAKLQQAVEASKAARVNMELCLHHAEEMVAQSKIASAELMTASRSSQKLKGVS